MSDTKLAIQKYTELDKVLKQGLGSVKAALPQHMHPERMLRLALTAFSSNYKLQQCTPRSILASLVMASQLGLEPGIGGQGWLIPYKQTCTFVPGWQGLVGLLNNTGRATAWTDAVFEGDVFKYVKGSEPKIIHEPGDNYGDPDKMTHVYACGKVNGSEVPVVEAWPVRRVLKHRDRFNKVGDDHYSFTHPEMYGRKVVLLQVLKYMPKSVELTNAMAVVHAAETGTTVHIESGVVIEQEPGDINADPSDPPKFTPAKAVAAPKEQPKAEPSTLAKAADPADPWPQVETLMKRDTVREDELLALLLRKKRVPEGTEQLITLNDAALAKIIADWDALAAQIRFDNKTAAKSAKQEEMPA